MTNIQKSTPIHSRPSRTPTINFSWVYILALVALAYFVIIQDEIIAQQLFDLDDIQMKRSFGWSFQNSRRSESNANTDKVMDSKTTTPAIQQEHNPNQTFHLLTPTKIRLPPETLEMIKVDENEILQRFQKDDEPRRHLRFSDLLFPPRKRGAPPMKTAYLDAQVVTQASWFPHRKLCNETCCAQAVAISIEQEKRRIITAVDGQDVAELLLHGNKLRDYHVFAAHELTHDVIPCLQPGVIIHADSYG